MQDSPGFIKQPKKKVLITEDDPAILDVLEYLFTRNGFDVISFANGGPLLRNEFEIPDIFLIDKQLSGVDGLDICTHLRARPETKNTPIIILSASPHVQRLAHLAGANDFVEKPFSNQALLLLVKKYL
jgi:DNA-binding response OmpR family regulator